MLCSSGIGSYLQPFTFAYPCKHQEYIRYDYVYEGVGKGGTSRAHGWNWWWRWLAHVVWALRIPINKNLQQPNVLCFWELWDFYQDYYKLQADYEQLQATMSSYRLLWAVTVLLWAIYIDIQCMTEVYRTHWFLSAPTAIYRKFTTFT
jgi:hypothetical protein